MRYLYSLLLFSILTFGQSVDIIKEVYKIEGVKVESYDYNGFEKFLKFNDETTYIINFWATWCAPCIKELPYFEEIGAKYKSKSVKVILVSLDFPKQVEKSLIPFIKRKKLESLVIHLDDPDSNSWIEKVDSNWSGAIPATIIYNKNNSRFYEQSFTFEALEIELKKMLNQ
ncbi:TlpA disulfide reductase family protein [Flavobacterium sp.]|uniref:TlpA disulfide reductase family protein n=1 Tax=Flavobacterium sp. TaxID=239 RepID=UPI0040482EAE